MFYWQEPQLLQRGRAMLSCFVSLNISLGDSSSLEMAPFDRSHTSSYRRSNVGHILYRFFLENRDSFHTPPAFDAHATGFRTSGRNTAIRFVTKKTRMALLPDSEKSLRIYLLVLIQYTNVTDRQTDEQTDTARRHTFLQSTYKIPQLWSEARISSW